MDAQESQRVTDDVNESVPSQQGLKHAGVISLAHLLVVSTSPFHHNKD